MTITNKTGLLGIVNAGLSLLYIVAFFVFGSSDSSYFDKEQVVTFCKIYGLLSLLVGGFLLYFSVGKDELHQVVKDVTYSSSEETLLDDSLGEKELNERNKLNVNAGLVLNSVHLTCALFFIIGRDLLNYRESTVVVFALVYAMLWVILGVTIFSIMFQEKI